MDNSREIENNKIAGVVMENILAERQRMGKKIILWDFQQDQWTDRLYFNVAVMTSDVLNENVYLDMPLIDFWKFKWRRRKVRKNLKRVGKKIKNEIEVNDRTSIYEIMIYVQRTFNLENDRFEEINNEFYGWLE